LCDQNRSPRSTSRPITPGRIDASSSNRPSSAGCSPYTDRGCRRQAYLLRSDPVNADSVCDLSPHHHLVTEAVVSANRLGSRPPHVDSRRPSPPRLLRMSGLLGHGPWGRQRGPPQARQRF
jgi:hypothetical protein